MKKKYLTPSIQMSEAVVTSFLAGSEIGGGTGTQPGSADAKSSTIWSNFDNNEDDEQ